MKYAELLPEVIFDSLEAQGYQPTGILIPLNSYENRVYEVGIETDAGPTSSIVVKYYRPGRWNEATITEEHLVLMQASEAEIPVVAPLVLKNPINSTKTLGLHEDLFFAVYPKFRGRVIPDLKDEEREWLGRTLARLHNLTDSLKLKHRLALDPQTYGYQQLASILNQSYLDPDLKKGCEVYLTQALQFIEPYFKRQWEIIPVHGDCHLSNVLWNKEGPYLLDFDDMVLAPPIQDMWMLFYGDNDEKKKNRDSFLKGYEVFRPFDDASLILIEPLRTLRMIRYAAWIGERYEEPAFQKAFPYYSQRKYWEEFLQNIKEQIGLLQEL